MSRDPALSGSQTFRLIALSILLSIPASVWVVGAYQQIAYIGFKPLPNWDVIHEHYNVVSELKFERLTTKHRNSLLMRWWSISTDGYLVFVIFSTSSEVITEYHRMWLWFKAAVLKYPPPVSEEEVKKLDTSAEYVVCQSCRRYFNHLLLPVSQRMTWKTTRGRIKSPFLSVFLRS
jgi:Pheromone A receptor